MRDVDYFSALRTACASGTVEEIQQLAESVVNFGSEGFFTDFLRHACKHGNLAAVQYLVEAWNMDIEEVNEDEDDHLFFNCLAEACTSGSLPLVKYLEERGASIDKLDNDDETPFVHACRGGHLHIVKYLMEKHSVDVEAKDRYGKSCLQVACIEGHLPVVKYLVEKAGANVGEEDLSGNTCLLDASYNGHANIVKYLIEEADADTEAKNERDENCLHRACAPRSPFRASSSQDRLPVIQYLLGEVIMNIEEQDEDGNTCLMLACSYDNLSIVQYLIEKGNASTTAQNNRKDTCLLWACRSNTENFPVVKYLLENHSIDIEEKNNRGVNALMMACERKHFLTVRYLVEEREANLEAVDADGRNCVHYACDFDSEILDYLLIKRWMEPPPLSSFPSYKKQIMKKYTTEYLNEKRRDFWTHRDMDVTHFIRESQLQQEWKCHQECTFMQIIPLYVTHVQELLETNPGPPADLKVCFSSSRQSSQSEQERIVVYAKKKRLSESCSFMHNLLVGEMNDVQDDPEHDRMQMVELSQDLIQDCPAEWLKQLIAFLSWSREGDNIRHAPGRNVRNIRILPFDVIMEALKYCRMCDTLGIDVDVSTWTDFIKKYVEKYNKQWIQSTLKSVKREKEFCIEKVKRFDQEMFELWTRVLGESDEVYFFMLVNAAPATAETRSTIASQCREWLMSGKSSQKYWSTLHNPLFVGILYLHTDFKYSTGVSSIPLETDEEFVQRKRRRIE